MFLVERLTKCRTTSGSESSGKGGGASLIAPAGSSSASGFAGTSHTGIRTAQQPGLESSNRSGVDWELGMVEPLRQYTVKKVLEQLRLVQRARLCAAMGQPSSLDRLSDHVISATM
jgi:hypothetical protein